MIRTTGVKSSCDLDNILKSEWDRNYRSSCGLDILNYELFGPFSGYEFDIMNFLVRLVIDYDLDILQFIFLIIIFLDKENVNRIPSSGISLAFLSLPSFFSKV